MGPLPLSVSIAPRPSLTDTNSVWNSKRGGGAMGSLGLPKLNSGARISGTSNCLAHCLVFRSVEKAVALWDVLVLFLSVPQGHVGHVKTVTLVL